MTAENFPKYLLAKQSVDDRALNKDVIGSLKENLPEGPFSILEVGAGIGTMVSRLLRWEIISEVSYTLVDGMEENILFGKQYLPDWAESNGYQVGKPDPNQFTFSNEKHFISVEFVHVDVFDFIRQNRKPADLLIAHAFLDLLPLPESLPALLSLTTNLAWLTLNFDGVSSLEPELDPVLDSQIESFYHATMDQRSSGGESRTGRKLFKYLRETGADILSAGSSDWVVYPDSGTYRDGEAYFLECILGFYQSSLEDHPALEHGVLSNWLDSRLKQIDLGELVYIAHQIDFLVRI